MFELGPTGFDAHDGDPAAPSEQRRPQGPT